MQQNSWAVMPARIASGGTRRHHVEQTATKSLPTPRQAPCKARRGCREPETPRKKAAVRRGADSRIGQERMTLGRLVDYLADGIDSTFGGGVGFAFK